MGLDLRAYLKQYHRTFSYDCTSIEKRFEDHRVGRESLIASDVKFLLHVGNAPFGAYWPQPNKKILDHLSRIWPNCRAPSRALTQCLCSVGRVLG